MKRILELVSRWRLRQGVPSEAPKGVVAPSASSWVRPKRLERVIVPMAAFDASIQHFQQEGQKHHEGFVLWFGVVDARGVAVVATVVVPKGNAHSGYARSSQESMIDIAEMVRGSRLVLLAQVHTHPHQAFHSPIDDAYPTSGRDGFLSLVLPWFAAEATSTSPGWEIFELFRGVWRQWSKEEHASRLEVIQNARNL